MVLVSFGPFSSAQTGAGLGGGLVLLRDSVDFGVLRNILEHAEFTSEVEALLSRMPCREVRFEPLAATPRGDRAYRWIMTFEPTLRGDGQRLRATYRYSSSAGPEPALPPDILTSDAE